MMLMRVVVITASFFISGQWLRIHAVRTYGTHRLNRPLDLDGPGFLKCQREFDEIALFERLLQIKQHDVVATRL